MIGLDSIRYQIIINLGVLISKFRNLDLCMKGTMKYVKNQVKMSVCVLAVNRMRTFKSKNLPKSHRVMGAWMVTPCSMDSRHYETVAEEKLIQLRG
jgi:hypothetical protein